MIHDVADQWSQLRESPQRSALSSLIGSSIKFTKLLKCNAIYIMRWGDSYSFNIETCSSSINNTIGNCSIKCSRPWRDHHRTNSDWSRIRNFIHKRMFSSEFHLKRSAALLFLVGVGATQSSKTRGVVVVSMNPVFNSDVSCMVKAYVLPKLTSMLPSVEPSISRGLKLKDCNSLIDRLWLQGQSTWSLELRFTAALYSLKLSKDQLSPP